MLEDIYEILRSLVMVIVGIPGIIFVFGYALIISPFTFIFRLKPEIKFNLRKI